MDPPYFFWGRFVLIRGMLAKLLQVRRSVDQVHQKGALPYQIDDIRRAIIDNTNVDRIEFVEVLLGENPIYGSYKRYEYRPGVYRDVSTKVDITYNGSLNYCWRRFVVCKEMCHAFDEECSSRVTDKAELDQLVEALTLPEPSRTALAHFPPILAETFAVFAAVELLCPLQERKVIAPKNISGQVSHMQIATEFRIPVRYVPTAFDRKYIEMVEEVFSKNGFSL